MTTEHKCFNSATDVLTNGYKMINEKFLNHEKLNYEEERIKSFASWPVHFPVDPSRLAKAGFYYTGNDDEVICFSCHGHVKDWNYDDVVLKKHAKLYPECDFINNKSSNVPLSKIPIKSKAQSLLNENTDNIINNISLYNNSVDYTKMKSESERLKTFTGKWPVNIVDLAHVGFFYTGIDDKVQCAYCKGIISNWEAGDIPYQEHLKHFPWCDYLSETIVKSKNGLSWFSAATEDICGNMGRHLPNSTSSHVNTSSNNRLIDKNQQHMNLEDLGVHLHKGPIHPQQASLTARLRSFVSWPSSAPVSKEDLAAAGFFYIGISDHTKCFHCNGGLCNWEGDDDPWVEHARWFCNCDFLRLNKGSDFIKSCIAQNPLLKETESKQQQTPQCQVLEPLMKKVDEAMNSSLIKYVLETGLFPSYIVRAAVLLQIKETGSSFSNMDELCIAVSYLKEEMEKEPINAKPVQAADLNICENISKNCAITDVSPELKNNACLETSDVLPASMNGNSFKKGCSSKLTNVPDDDASKDHCLCKICMDKEVGVVFLPCGHLLSCTICAPALKYCPMCRKTIRATVRAYLN